MNRSFIRTAQIVLTLALAIGAAVGQNTVPAADKYKISAKAGMVNFSQGLTSVTRPDGTTGTLITGDQLNAGDRVITSAGGSAEVLLNPGSYIRLGGESEFSFRVTSLDDLRLEVKRGSAILEVVATDQFRVTAYTPKGRVTIVNTGVYRLDVGSDGRGLVSVIDGKVVVGERNIAEVKKGQTGTVNGGVVMVGKFDRDKRDALAAWSRSRSKDLAKMSSAFNAKNTRPLILDSLINSYYAGLWGRSRTMGVWVFDRGSGTCLFIPFFSDWTSPYGFGYNSCTCNYYFPPNIRPVIPARPAKVYTGLGGDPIRAKNNGRDGIVEFPSGGFEMKSPTKVLSSPSAPSSPVYLPPLKRDKP